MRGYPQAIVARLAMAPARVPLSSLRLQLRRTRGVSGERLEVIERLAAEERRARRSGRPRRRQTY
jgi:hypothetical protein